ncbi:hypothetical protein SUGI_0861170 [Cryptomeria japonica]|nr:hypothetical protein SUGI_0861170 [Cryptomeria japonica]
MPCFLQWKAMEAQFSTLFCFHFEYDGDASSFNCHHTSKWPLGWIQARVGGGLTAKTTIESKRKGGLDLLCTFIIYPYKLVFC